MYRTLPRLFCSYYASSKAIPLAPEPVEPTGALRLVDLSPGFLNETPGERGHDHVHRASNFRLFLPADEQRVQHGRCQAPQRPRGAVATACAAGRLVADAAAQRLHWGKG
jgi:hypothetical protein